MWEWQQGLCEVVVLREAEWSLSLTQPGAHRDSQDLTVPHPELTTETCHIPERARTDRLSVQPLHSHLLTISGLSEEKFILYNQPRTLETLKGNCCTSRSSTEPIPSPAPWQAHITPNPFAGRARLSTEGI